jgi:gamma-glutamyltranspeptidase / glutathione hydrolase
MTFKPIIAAFAVFLIACCAPAPPPRGEAMAAAADPRAVEAALEMLRQGGSAVDAAIAAELVLGLVEPQSSGIGGGGFLLHYDAASERISGYDGRERAPAGASATMFLDAAGKPLDFYDAQASGASIGTPLLMHMLKLAHEDHGRLDWALLFAPAIALADNGFAISPKLAGYLGLGAHELRLREDFEARAYFFDAEGEPWPAGHLLRNPAYAQTLRALASDGPAAMSHGAIAEAVVAAARRAPRAGALSLDDLRAASARRFEPICAPYRAYRACTAAPPSSANAMLAILGLYQRARPHPDGPANADDWAGYLWASRLAYADRDHYMADDEFVQAPTQELIAPAYLDERARLIDLSKAPTRIAPGMPAGRDLYERWGADLGDDAGTTHLSIVDAWGNAVALTATVESYFGAQRMASGFLLNNQLTDFSFAPTLNGRPVANAVAPDKRPRSSMSPAIFTDGEGELVLVVGSPGGSDIIGYVARASIAILDWNLPVRDALALGNATGRFQAVPAEPERWPAGVGAELSRRGWRFTGVDGGSGLHAIRVTAHGLEGGADPRGEGAVGNLPAPR